MRLLLDQIVRYWRGKEEQGQNTTIEFVETFKANMQVVRDLAYEKEIKEKESQKFYHDWKSVVRNFDVGEYVLVFRPIRKSIWKINDKVHISSLRSWQRSLSR